MTYITALRAGFQVHDAYTIAYASQYTDDNDTSYDIADDTFPYKNYISQTMDSTKPKEALLRIYPYFHFFPGTTEEIVKKSGPRKDGKLHLLNTIPDSRNVRKLMLRSLKSMDLWRIGIATHTYADTFCHQNFVGVKDSFNDMKGFIEEIIPGIGHADARHKPDIPGLIWQDTRLVSDIGKINNKERMLDAAGNIFLLYCRHCTKQKNDEKKKASLIRELADAIGAVSKKDNKKRQRKKNYKAILRSATRNVFEDYDKDAWFTEAVSFRPQPEFVGTPNTGYEYSWKAGYEESAWLRFQEAVKYNQGLAETILKPLMTRLEIPAAIW